MKTWREESPGTLGIGEWIAHYDIDHDDAEQSPYYFGRNNVTNYFPKQNENWNLERPKYKTTESLVDTYEEELEARNTVIHSLLEMLNASNTPVAYKISKEDPYLTPQERNIVNKEIDSWHDLPDDLKGIQLARYIRAGQVNLKNARNFTRSSFKLDGEESDTEALLTSNNISLRSEVESLNIDKSVLKSRVTSLENDSMLLRNNLQNTQKKLTKAQKSMSK